MFNSQMIEDYFLQQLSMWLREHSHMFLEIIDLHEHSIYECFVSELILHFIDPLNQNMKQPYFGF